MSAIFGTKYAGFIAGAYGITTFVLLALIVWTIVTWRARSRALVELEEAGLKRARRRDT